MHDHPTTHRHLWCDLELGGKIVIFGSRELFLRSGKKFWALTTAVHGHPLVSGDVESARQGQEMNYPGSWEDEVIRGKPSRI